MMGNRKIVVTIDAAGGTSIETHNFSGSSCVEATAAIEKALGTPVDRAYKEEFYAEERAEQHVEQQW